ncbi:MAG: phosphopantetheine-binding protein [Lentimicrobiaceae bacterium]|nr:phosphopantetheine-binding protein [Lentimicrobiaceae bacterium]
MTRTEIENKVNTFLVDEIEVEPHLIKPEALLKEDLGIDSLDFVDIVVIVEQIFGYRIKAEEMAEVLTLNQFYDFIENVLNSKA